MNYDDNEEKIETFKTSSKNTMIGWNYMRVLMMMHFGVHNGIEKFMHMHV